MRTFVRGRLFADARSVARRLILTMPTVFHNANSGRVFVPSSTNASKAVSPRRINIYAFP
jgi:hypothetical protein